MGTHIHAPVHTVEGEWKTNQIPLEKLYRSGVIIKVKTKAVTDPDNSGVHYHNLIVTCIHIELKDRVNCNILFIFLFWEIAYNLQSLSMNN